MIGVELRLVQYRFSVFVVVAQEVSSNVMVFGRVTKIFTRVRGRRCNSSSNAAGFCMLFCYFGYLSGMLEYHAIGRILCSAFTLCQHEFPPLETKKNGTVEWAVFPLALGYMHLGCLL